MTIARWTALSKAGLILGVPGDEMAKAKTAFQKEAGRCDDGDDGHGGDQVAAADGVERLLVDHMDLEVEHRRPDPHRREELDERETQFLKRRRTPSKSMAKPPTRGQGGEDPADC